jgi:hypothetical protein
VRWGKKWGDEGANADLSKLIPKMATLFKRVELAHTQKITNEPVLMALTCKLIGVYNEFNPIEEWYTSVRKAASAQAAQGAKKRKAADQLS